MLKLALLPTARDLERALEAAYRAFYQILEASSSRDRLVIRVYPNLDPIVAGVIVASRVLRVGAEVSIKVSLNPPPIIDEPTVLLGYNRLDYHPSNVTSPMLAIASGSVESIPVHGTTFVGGQGSNVAIATLVVTGGTNNIGIDLASMTLLGIYAGNYVDSVGKLSGLDRVLVEKLSSSLPGLDIVTTIKVYKPHVLEFCEAISTTAYPLYLGLAGDPWRCQEVLGIEKYRSVAGKPLSSITDAKEIEYLAKQVINFMHLNFRSKISAKDMVAGMLVSKSREAPIQDYREACDALIYASDSERSLARVVATLLDFSIEIPLAESQLESSAKVLSNIVAEGSITKVGSTQRFKVYSVGAKPGAPLTLLWRALKVHGFIESDSILVVEEGDEFLASPIQIEEALGYGALNELNRANLIKFDGEKVWIEKRALDVKHI
ncbi:MAG: hypothetical protein QXV55_05955 [Acidilobaceae archaeon]